MGRGGAHIERIEGDAVLDEAVEKRPGSRKAREGGEVQAELVVPRGRIGGDKMSMSVGVSVSA